MSQKKVLITGASRGLGLCLCKAFLEAGYYVYALSRSIGDELKALEGDIEIYQCDVSDYESVQQCRKAIKIDRLDVIVNNAGVWLEVKRLDLLDSELEMDLFYEQFNVNAMGVVHISREFLPLLQKSDKAIMINMSSEAGSIENCWRDCEYGYCMSKAAQNMATKIMSNAYPQVKFYAIHPGWLKTEQGYAGATGVNKPQQKPEDTAREMVDLAEGNAREKIYYDITGEEMPW